MTKFIRAITNTVDIVILFLPGSSSEMQKAFIREDRLFLQGVDFTPHEVSRAIFELGDRGFLLLSLKS